MSYDNWMSCKEFNAYVTLCGSRFAAVNYIAKLAQARRRQVHYCISESQSLTWVLTGKEPELLQTYRMRRKLLKAQRKQFVEDHLGCIEDEQIRAAVQHSIYLSNQQNHLIYDYIDISEENRQARVRVICNIVWDGLGQLNVDSQI